MQKTYYERTLPHIQPIGGSFFITYRLYGSIPVEVLKQLKDEAESESDQARKVFSGEELNQKIYEIQRNNFGKYDRFLDHNPNEPHWLMDERVCRMVADSLHECARRYFHLHAFCIMPNHVHLLLTQFEKAPILWKIMQIHKGFTARKANKLLERDGAFWMPESYDHVVRNSGEFERIFQYILLNPVKARLIENWEDWPWTYAAPP